MLHEEEIALRRALHASLASKTASDEDPKPTKTKQSDKGFLSVDKSLANLQQQEQKSSVGPAETKVKSQKSKRKSDESGEHGDEKRQRKLLVRIKPKSRKERPGTNGVSRVVKKKVVKSKTLLQKKKMTVNENEGKVIKRRRRKRKNVDAIKDEGNTKSTERLNKMQISITDRSLLQTLPHFNIDDILALQFSKGSCTKKVCSHQPSKSKKV